jgi:hypothetical protein
MGGLGASTLDHRPDDATWTIREVMHHVSNVTAYADTIGRLAADPAWTGPLPTTDLESNNRIKMDLSCLCRPRVLFPHLFNRKSWTRTEGM